MIAVQCIWNRQVTHRFLSIPLCLNFVKIVGNLTGHVYAFFCISWDDFLNVNSIGNISDENCGGRLNADIKVSAVFAKIIEIAIQLSKTKRRRQSRDALRTFSTLLILFLLEPSKLPINHSSLAASAVKREYFLWLCRRISGLRIKVNLSSNRH
jgi:hypothetical protein